MAGGLGDYGSEESEDEDEHSVRGSESSDTDEEELHHRIREKQDAFRRKEREMFLLQEKQAQDALLARGETLTYSLLPINHPNQNNQRLHQLCTNPGPVDQNPTGISNLPGILLGFPLALVEAVFLPGRKEICVPQRLD